MNEHNRDADINSTIAGLLRDMAIAQQSPQRQWGYKQAGKAIRGLDLPVDELVLPDGTLARIPHIGPASTRIILEVLSSGTFRDGRTGDRRERPAHRGRAASGVAREFSQPGRSPAHSDAGPAARGLPRRSADALHVERRQPDARRDRRRLHGSRLCLCSGHRSLGGLPIAGGLSTARLAAQAGEIERVNQALEGRFRLLRGVEANIRADGEVDVDPADRRQLEIVVAAPHSGLRSALPQTDRMLAAVSSPGVHILGHPRGRMYGSRPGVAADWPRIFETAARTGVAIEIDGDPSRQDLDFELARQARDAGCLFALDSDAHSVAQLAYAEIAMAHALLAGLQAEHVINCWPLERLLEWAACRQR